MDVSFIENIYRANLGLGHLTALTAVFSQGYCLGLGASTPKVDITPIAPTPPSVVVLSQPSV